MAIGATAEYTQQVQGVNNAMSSMVSATNIMNEIYEREVNVTFMLIDNNEVLIETDPNNQAYVDVDMGGSLVGQNHGILVDKIGVDAFDIGHVFTIACSDGVAGIAALGSLCDDNRKGNGVTCIASNQTIMAAVSTIMSHEVGHQFSATHSWNYCAPVNPQNPNDDPNVDENRTASTAYEPGSGTTIMSYAGVCGANNVQFQNDTYFHVGNLIQVANHRNNDNVKECGIIENVDNDLPSVSFEYNNGFHIPMSTPFKLTAQGSDPNGDGLLYCWEQVNTHFVEYPLGQQFHDSPSFRSFPPDDDPTRIFPRLTAILNNNTFNIDDELLADYARNLKFRCTVRDDYAGSAGVVWTDELSFEVTDAAGPFVILSPNLSTDEWTVGDLVEVTWDVANTNVSPVNSKRVNILLSTNTGFDFLYTLATQIDNDGSHMVVVPNLVTNGARIMVESADNIFFDINDSRFSILPPTEPGFLFAVGPDYQQVCLPAEVNLDITTDSLLGYDSLLTFTVTGLPPGAVANFSKNRRILLKR